MGIINATRRTLLLSSIAPTTLKTGGIVLHQLVKLMPTDSVACAIVPDRWHYPRVDKDLSTVPTKYFLRLNEYPRTFIPSKASQFIDQQYIRQLTKKIVDFGKEQKVEAVWCILEGLTQIYLAKTIADRLEVPLLTQVWDPPTWWLRARGVRKDYVNLVLDAFEADIRQSRSCAVTSWAMAESYQKKYGAKTSLFLPSLPKELALSPASFPHTNDTLTIALAGQVYADDAWDSLIRALDSVQWKIMNRRVTIHLFGRHDKVEPLNHPNLIKVGWTSQAETIRSLSGMDILYCPYWFDPAFSEEVNMSFPSKLITYFASGKPVFYHGPSTAGPATFIKEQKAGYTCFSTDPKEILQKLSDMISDTQAYKDFAIAGSNAFAQYFTLDRLTATFESFINA